MHQLVEPRGQVRNDPRVLFATERTLLAWNRTAIGLMGFGFLVGVALLLLSVRQYRRVIRSLGSEEIPPGYWVRAGVLTNVAVALLGLMLAAYLILMREA